MSVTRAQLARYIDHTQLKAFATEGDIRELCVEAMREGFASVSINGAWVSYCAKQLGGTGVGVYQAAKDAGKLACIRQTS